MVLTYGAGHLCLPVSFGFERLRLQNVMLLKAIATRVEAGPSLLAYCRLGSTTTLLWP